MAHDGARPTLVLDAGTGLRNVTRHLDGEPFRGTVLLGHLHWDHTDGLPFFNAEQVLARAFSPPHFPITPAQLEGRWTFTSHEPGHHDIEGFQVVAAEIPHKGGRTFGYRVSDGGATLAYLSAGAGPHGLGTYHASAMALAGGVDLLIHDAPHTASEFATRAYLGHSTVEYALGLAEAAGARTLVLFHHDPNRTDDEIDALVGAHTGGGVEVTAAAEGLSIDL